MRVRGFTLLEVLTSITIIMILSAILLTIVTQTRDRARVVVCLDNQRQIALALAIWTQDHDETLPDATTVWKDLNLSGDTNLFVCPNAKTHASNAYLYTNNVSLRVLGDYLAPSAVARLIDPQSEIMTLDGTHEATLGNTSAAPPLLPTYQNVYYTAQDAAFRHRQKFIASFVDSHVELTDVTPTQDITWIPTVGAQATPSADYTGSSLQRTQSGTGYNFIGAVSTLSMPGDSVLLWRFAATNHGATVGLLTTTTLPAVPAFTYAIQAKNDGTAVVLENGVFYAPLGPYAVSDVFAIRREKGLVSFLKNGTVFYSATNIATTPYFAGATFEDVGAQLLECRYRGAW